MITTDSKRLRQDLEDAEYRAEQLQREVENYRRTERRAADERERKRAEERRARHPSNRLYRGDVRDFNEAVRCRIEVLQAEIVTVSEEFKDLDEKSNARMETEIAEANRAARIYGTVMREGLMVLKAQTVKALRDADLAEWADCLEQDGDLMLDDYDNFKPLAIAVSCGVVALWLIVLGWWLGRRDVLLTFRQQRRARRRRVLHSIDPAGKHRARGIIEAWRRN